MYLQKSITAVNTCKYFLNISTMYSIYVYLYISVLYQIINLNVSIIDDT